MFGTPADMMLTDTYLKGIRDFDVEAAYQAMRKTALGPTQNSRFSGRAGIEDYLKFRYCPSDLMKQSVARTLEYSYADHAIARLGRGAGHIGRRGPLREARPLVSAICGTRRRNTSSRGIRTANSSTTFDRCC